MIAPARTFSIYTRNFKPLYLNTREEEVGKEYVDLIDDETKNHIISFINKPQYGRFYPIAHKFIVRDVNLIVGVIDNGDFIYFDFNDEITSSNKFIDFFIYETKPCTPKY